jgi:nicotinamide mononucleotide transporter
MQEIIKLASNWIHQNYIQSIASILGLINIYFGIKEKAIFWILATLNAILFFIVFFNAKMYAYMLLQTYYITISIYGFYYWLKGSKKENQKKINISKISKKNAIIASVAFVSIYFIIVIILKNFTNSKIPFADSFMTTSSMLAAFFMMKKWIESWYIWIISDVIITIILFSQCLYAAGILQIFYWIFAIIGFLQWKKSMSAQN